MLLARVAIFVEFEVEVNCNEAKGELIFVMLRNEDLCRFMTHLAVSLTGININILQPQFENLCVEPGISKPSLAAFC